MSDITMKTLFYLLLLFWTFSAPAGSGSQDTEIRCATFFEQVSQLAESPGEADSFVDISLIETPTVDVVQEVAGQHGGKLFLIQRRDGAQWGSVNKTVGFDPQGDPRWFIEILGPKAAAFFGFKKINSSYMTVPNQIEFNTALIKVNKALEQQGEPGIPIHFYATGNDNNVKVRDYIEKYVNNLGIPIAQSGNHLIHDLSFHTSSIILPKEILHYKAAAVEFQMEFFKYLKEKHKNDSEETKKAISFYEFLFAFEATTDIDSLTGLIGPMLINYMKKEPKLSDQVPEIDLAEMIYLVYPGERSIADTFQSFHEEWFISEDHYEKLKHHWPTLSPSAVVDAIQAFAKTWRSQRYPEFRADQHLHNSEKDFEDFVSRLCKKITARRAKIIQTVQQLL